MTYKKTGSFNRFDLSSYETVKQRKTRIRNDYPESVIYPMQVSGVSYADKFVVYIALVWKDYKTKNSSPEAISAVGELLKTITPDNAPLVAASIGLILNADSTGHSLSIANGLNADKNAWVENCEESAVGRALDNLGYHSGSCSAEEMIKVKQTEETRQTRVRLENQITAILSNKDNKEDLSGMYQLCVKATKPFNTLDELSIQELEKVYDIVSSKSKAIF